MYKATHKSQIATLLVRAKDPSAFNGCRGKVMSATNRLIIAIQRKGRLSEDSLSLLQRCGLKLVSSKSSLFYSSGDLPLDVLLVRDDDIPLLIQDNICDLGIIGENVLQEQEKP